MQGGGQTLLAARVPLTTPEINHLRAAGPEFRTASLRRWLKFKPVG
jgi:hypothetical protein